MSIDPHYNTPAWFQPEELGLEVSDEIGEVVRTKLPGKHRVEPILVNPDENPEASEAARPEPAGDGEAGEAQVEVPEDMTQPVEADEPKKKKGK